MHNLKTPQGTVKKGVAHFGRTSTVNATVVAGGAIPLFEQIFYNDDSLNIINLNSTQIKLLKNKKYKINANIGVNPVSLMPISYGVWDVTRNMMLGSVALVFPPTYPGDTCSYTDAYCIIEATVDTIIEIRNATASTSFNYVYAGSSVIVEELEAYLIPTDPTKYIETINFTGVSGTGASGVVIASGLPVGTKKLIRKINTTQGIVEISCNGETFTPSALSNIRLNKNGDFFLIEKVTSTRWDLVDGKETYDGAFSYIKRADGTAEETSDAYYCVNGNTTVPLQVITGASNRFIMHIPNNNWAPQTLFHIYGTNVNISNAFAGNTFRIKSLGVWY